MKEIYIIQETDENTWSIIDENGEVVETITKDDIVNYCKNELEDNRTDCMSASDMIDDVWFDVERDYNLEFVDSYCQDFDKFCAWFDYVYGLSCTLFVHAMVYGCYFLSLAGRYFDLFVGTGIQSVLS